MITCLQLQPAGDDTFYCKFIGLSTDEKPTTYNGHTVGNGSSFIEMDTGTIYHYDGSGIVWLAFPIQVSTSSAGTAEGGTADG